MPSNTIPQSLQPKPNPKILPLFTPNAGSSPTKEELPLPLTGRNIQ
jgi:hypothetical protein